MLKTISTTRRCAKLAQPHCNTLYQPMYRRRLSSAEKGIPPRSQDGLLCDYFYDKSACQVPDLSALSLVSNGCFITDPV